MRSPNIRTLLAAVLLALAPALLARAAAHALHGDEGVRDHRHRRRRDHQRAADRRHRRRRPSRARRSSMQNGVITEVGPAKKVKVPAGAVDRSTAPAAP